MSRVLSFLSFWHRLSVRTTTHRSTNNTFHTLCTHLCLFTFVNLFGFSHIQTKFPSRSRILKYCQYEVYNCSASDAAVVVSIFSTSTRRSRFLGGLLLYLLYINVRVRHLRLFRVCETTAMFGFQVWNFLLPWDEIKRLIKILYKDVVIPQISSHSKYRRKGHRAFSSLLATLFFQSMPIYLYIYMVCICTSTWQLRALYIKYTTSVSPRPFTLRMP